MEGSKHLENDNKKGGQRTSFLHPYYVFTLVKSLCPLTGKPQFNT